MNQNAFPEQSSPPRKNYLAIGLVGLLVLVAVGLISTYVDHNQKDAKPAATVTVTAQETASTQETAPESAPATQEPEMTAEQRDFLLNLPRRKADDPMAKGEVTAPVVLTEWADYRCPYCVLWGEQTLPKLQPLIDDGTLRVEFRDMAIFGEDSVKAAAAARAAGAQGKYFEYQAALYAALPDSGHPDVSDELVMQTAEKAGVSDLEAFEKDYQSKETRDAVLADTEQAKKWGVQSTPAFLVGTQFVSGAQPLKVFQQVIAEQAAELG